jgi:1,4-alpha-glucan branching enzyme
MPNSLERLLTARHHDPFAILGLHPDPAGWVLRVFRPDASRVSLLLPEGNVDLFKSDGRGLFEWRGALAPARPWRLAIEADGQSFEITDPYAFGPLLSDQEIHLFNEGRLLEAWRSMGAQPTQLDGTDGVRFAVWAPNAERVSVVGGLNNWDGRIHAMRVRGGSGIWELFIPGLAAGDLYKYEIRNRDTSAVIVKADPYAQGFEMRPGTAAVVPGPSRHAWGDGEWLQARARRDWLHAPMNIYEMHAGSWRRHDDGAFLQLARTGRHPGALRHRPGLHPSGADADHRAPAGRVLGLPDHRLLRSRPPASARRTTSAISWTPATRPASASSWTGCPATSPWTPGPWPASTAPPSTSTKIRAWACTRIGAPISSTTAAAR